MPTKVIGGVIDKQDLLDMKMVRYCVEQTAQYGEDLPANQDYDLFDTGHLDKLIKIEEATFLYNSPFIYLWFDIYDKEGNLSGIQTIPDVHGGNFRRYGVCPDSLNSFNVAKETPYWKLLHYDSSSNKYVIALNKPVYCYGFHAFVHNSDSVTRKVVAYVKYFVLEE